MVPLKRPIYIKMVDGLENVSFVVVNTSRSVDYYSASEIPLALSNMFANDSVVYRAKVRLASDDADALRITRQHAKYAKTIEIFTP